ncbi:MULTISPECIES: ABC transporter permease [Streptomyces]|uniref:Peptide ABC transporter permease n=1 Tax=Streptomyces venezuelae TaxID=54571 RepID=A0A5P2BFX2_STRVZ|nr:MULTISPECIES: ABC transporter permease [Streptomyces]NDZ99417.1 ABC transporter permease [Streptomyces sp. SID10116]MYY82948.1 ABC transporter permease subunit [Streptomyces sp. SID335]MYZ12341.1 ABC transporter permease subunit [Streptomyces sp. SID337]NDZ86962.1 ABC transporter permease [Streptomyces sp. SID10115]NEB49837.1 ABC transporter permease [Streptomyces sp. SID339]
MPDAPVSKTAVEVSPATARPEDGADTAAAGVSATKGNAAGGQGNKARSLWGDAWYELRHRPMFWISASLLVLLLLIAAFPGVFTGADPRDGDLTNHFLSKPELTHFFQADWFGYDAQGRSIYARVIYGTRASVLVGVGVTVLVTLLGGLLGMLAGYFGGWIDSVISRITDIFFGLPFLLGTMVILNAFTERKVYVVIASLAFLGWTSIARVTRSSVISAKQADYVTAARALGAGTTRMLFRHVMPNAIAPTIVVATIALGGYISAEATLSYLGLGLADPTISWGIDISEGSTAIRDNPHALFFPAGMLSITVFAFIMLGDAVRDALDPKLR